LKDGTGTELETAWAFWVQCNMSFASNMFGGFAFNNSVATGDPTTGGLSPQPQNTHNKKARFANYANCLESAEIFNRDALNVIRLKDTPKTLHYCDPPYVGSDCGHYKGYTQENFDSLIELLASIQGKFILSSYPNEALIKAREQYGWRSIDIVQNLRVDGKATQGKTKTECLTFNYPLESERQTTML
jgi:DNA adenine methylase